MLLVAIALIAMQGPDGQTIYVNPGEIVSMRAPREQKQALHPDVACIITTADGKIVATIESCEAIRARVGGLPNP